MIFKKKKQSNMINKKNRINKAKYKLLMIVKMKCILRKIKKKKLNKMNKYLRKK